MIEDRDTFNKWIKDLILKEKNKYFGVQMKVRTKPWLHRKLLHLRGSYVLFYSDYVEASPQNRNNYPKSMMIKTDDKNDMWANNEVLVSHICKKLGIRLK